MSSSCMVTVIAASFPVCKLSVSACVLRSRCVGVTTVGPANGVCMRAVIGFDRVIGERWTGYYRVALLLSSPSVWRLFVGLVGGRVG